MLQVREVTQGDRLRPLKKSGFVKPRGANRFAQHKGTGSLCHALAKCNSGTIQGDRFPTLE